MAQDAPESQSEVADNREKAFSNGDFYVGGWRDGVRGAIAIHFPAYFLETRSPIILRSPRLRGFTPGLMAATTRARGRSGRAIPVHGLMRAWTHAGCDDFGTCAELALSHMQEGRKHGVGKQVWASGASYQGED